MLAHLLFNLSFLANFFLNLLECLKEELLNLRSLIQNDLSKSLNLLELSVFAPEDFSCIEDLLTLLFNDGLVLEANHFLLLFEITNDLLE